MSQSRRALVISGATGKQGGSLIKALLDTPSQPFDIYAITRDSQSASAKALASKPNVHVVQGSFDQPGDIFAQVPKPWGLFPVSTGPICNKQASTIEENNAKAMHEAALEAGVQHIIYTSVNRGFDSDNTTTEIPHFKSKKHIEDHLKQQAAVRKTAALAIVRPVGLMENSTMTFFGKTFAAMWRQNGDKKLQLIASSDIGRVAADALLNAGSPEYHNKSISIARDELTASEAAVVFKEVTGQDMLLHMGFLGRCSTLS